MIRQALALTVALGAALHGPSCGDVDSSSGVNAPCTRNRDCHSGLVCDQGVCVAEDAGPDGASPSDAAAPDDAAAVDAGDG